MKIILATLAGALFALIGAPIAFFLVAKTLRDRQFKLIEKSLTDDPTVTKTDFVALKQFANADIATRKLLPFSVETYFLNWPTLEFIIKHLRTQNMLERLPTEGKGIFTFFIKYGDYGWKVSVVNDYSLYLHEAFDKIKKELQRLSKEVLTFDKQLDDLNLLSYHAFILTQEGDEVAYYYQDSSGTNKSSSCNLKVNPSRKNTFEKHYNQVLENLTAKHLTILTAKD